VRRAAVCSEKDVHERGDVGVVAGIPFAGMVPMMQFGSADERAQRADRKADVGMDVNGPETAKSQHSGNSFQREAHDEGRQID
jgi:hypothetical protein